MIKNVMIQNTQITANYQVLQKSLVSLALQIKKLRKQTVIENSETAICPTSTPLYEDKKVILINLKAAPY